MEENNWPEKVWNVCASLYKNRENYVFGFVIREGIESIISEGELDTILEDLNSKGIALCRVYNYDGTPSGLFEFKLSLKGILLFEENQKQGIAGSKGPKTSTATKYAEYVAEYNRLTRSEKHTHNDAVDEICKKYKISEKTLNRALKKDD